MDFPSELLKLGPAGLLCVFLWIMLHRSEQREEKKDARIRDLETQIKEVYAERIEASESVAEALHGNASALSALTTEIRTLRR